MLLLLLFLQGALGSGIVNSNIPIFVFHTDTDMPTCCGASCCAAKTCGMPDCLLVKAMDIGGMLDVYETGATSGTKTTYNISMSVHGQSTAVVFPKQAYNIRFVDNNNSKIEQELLGLPADKKFVIKAPYADQSLMHDALAFQMMSQMNRYASRSRLIEVYIAPKNVSDSALSEYDHYKGVYILEETIRRNSARVNVSKDSGEPASTGWILSVDKHTDPLDAYYKSVRNTTIQIVYPDLADNETYTAAQAGTYSDYIMVAVNEFENALFSPSFRDSTSGYAAFIDVDSFVDYFIHTEMTTSVDAYRFSVYFHKESCVRSPTDCKLKMGPAWDYDLSLGACGDSYSADSQACATNYWRFEWEGRQTFFSYTPSKRPEGPSTAQWLLRLTSDPAFVNRVRARYQELRNGPLKNDFFMNFIDGTALNLTSMDAAKRNFLRWYNLDVDWVWPYRDKPTNPYRPLPRPKTYDDEVAYLKRWVTARLAWLDGAVMRPLPHTYTTLGTSCDIRGPYWNASSGPDCAADCGQDTINTTGYPECARKIDECFRVFNGQELGAVPPIEPDDGPYGSFAADGVLVGSACEFLRYINRHKPDRCPPPPAAPTPLFCAFGTCSASQDPPTPMPTAPLTLAPSVAPTTPVSKAPSAQGTPTASPPTDGVPTAAVPTPLTTTAPSRNTSPTAAQSQEESHTPEESATHWYVFAIVGSVLLFVVAAVCYRQYRIRKSQVVPLVPDAHHYSPPAGGIQ